MAGTSADPAGIDWTVGLGPHHPGGSGGGQVHQLGAAEMAAQFHAAAASAAASGGDGGGGLPQASVPGVKAGRYQHNTTANSRSSHPPHIKNSAGSFTSSLQLPPALRIHLHAQALDLLRQLPASDERHKELPPKYHSVYPLDHRAKLRSSSGSYGYPTAVYKAVISEGEIRVGGRWRVCSYLFQMQRIHTLFILSPCEHGYAHNPSTCSFNYVYEPKNNDTYTI